jgi:hypothetical protein
MKKEGFILMTVMIFVLLLSLLVEQAFYSAQLEQRLWISLERRNYLYNLAIKGINKALKGKFVCNKLRCVKSEWVKDQNIITSKALDGDMQICIKAVFLKREKVKWQQVENC